MVSASAGTRAILGQDRELGAAIERAVRVARTAVPVVVSGESGTGKELFARLIHERGPAPAGPLVAVNCGALPRELAETELFGHERGAFTGAGGRRLGWFEEAHGGTLVLDEVGELPLDLQPKLLRVLETGRLRRVGGTGEVAVTVRVVALTLRDLRSEVARGAFRTDLYHRLAGFELVLPPLRRRRGDIPLLVSRFLEELGTELGPRTLAPDALDRLVRHDWPGNVRELRNVLWRAAILHPGRIEAAALDLPPPAGYARLEQPAGGASLAADGDGPPPPLLSPSLPPPTPPRQTTGDATGDLLSLAGRTFADIERAVLAWALRGNGGSRRRAARALGMARSTFWDRARRYRLC
jgi:transcriptional regulator with GAF, ATPase, and Fis domain